MAALKVAFVVNYAPGLSGMYGSVRELYFATRTLGLDARIVDDSDGKSVFGGYGKDGVTPAGFQFCDEADIICWHHAVHDDWLNEPHRNIVMWLHGTPEFNLATELASADKVLSLTIGAANAKIPKAFVTMWPRHVPIWESLLRTKVEYIPCWVDLDAFTVSPLKVDPNVIRIAMVDYWRLTREPFGLVMAIDRLKKMTSKRIEVNVWGLLEMPNQTWKAVIQWLVEDGTMILKGNTDKPMADIYHQNDMVLSMSTEETRVIREAYACGVPVVCGRTVPDVSGYCADSVHPEAVAEQILKCHNDLCANESEIRRRLRDRAETSYSPNSAARAAAKLFQSVVREHGSVNYPKYRVGGKRMVQSVKETAGTIMERMKKNEPVCYTRFGDGTLLLMSGHEGWDYWHHQDPKLREELTACFKDFYPGYIVGCSAGQENEGRMRKGLFARHEVDDALRKIAEATNPGKTYANAVALLYQSVFDKNWFVDLLNTCIRPRRPVLVCNEMVAASEVVRRVLNVGELIVVPAVDAYRKIDAIMDQLNKSIAGGAKLILSSAGPVSNVIGRRLCLNRFIQQGGAFLDIGSISDGLAGIESHGWIKLVGDSYRNGYAALYAKDVAVDIIVLSHGKPELTQRCFESIQQHTVNRHRIIWVDNGSPEADVQAVMPTAQNFAICELVRSPENLGFSKAVNLGLQRSLSTGDAEYVLLLNNDIVVTPGWLERLVGTLEFGGYAAAGPLTSENNPHSLDVLRAVVPELPNFNGESPVARAQALWEKFGYRSLKSENMLSFFCCLLRKSAVRAAGQLDENLFCYGEDNDYCRRLIRQGGRLGIGLGCYVHHDHHATANAMGDGWIQEQQAKAVGYLAAKWKDVPAGAIVGPAWVNQ